MNYKIEPAKDGSIQLTKQQPNVHSNPVSVKPGDRHETGWTFEELQALGKQASHDLKQRVRILIRSKGKDLIEVEPGPGGPAGPTKSAEQSVEPGKAAKGGITFGPDLLRAGGHGCRQGVLGGGALTSITRCVVSAA